ncbi:MAG: beta-galactosidase [Flavobacterium sp.]|uniref:beta-galactosidase n=1 Tax=Flavobacterium sp. TaxID=239 RepID=UPI001B06656F|nr:beta-galactosidase [Flavobacterium sp.]MBO9586240.1 beta-galactosidase [Flavobacterium sp.]
MKKILFICFVFCHLIVVGQGNSVTSSAQTSAKGDFTLGNREFLLNGKPFLIRAAELHYPRIPKQYWDQRIKNCRAMGMNTICIYLFWNYHEEEQDKFDFSGEKDIVQFVKLIQENGMYCIIRPGPYVCAEWDMGGLPWWLLKKENIQLRTLSDPFFMARASKFLGEVGKRLAPLQIQNGGPIIMAQVENEYAAFGNSSEYMEVMRKNLRSAGFDKVQLMRCDWGSNFDAYKTDPEVAITLNFGAGSNIEKQFGRFKEQHPTAPLMCSEYWTGWYDRYGLQHETRSVDTFIGSLKEMLDQKISFSLYMAHGGTNFGQWGGANSGPYTAMVTSYDYDAPISEQGNIGEKFYAVRDLLKNYLNPGETLGEIPNQISVMEIPKIQFTQSASLFENLPKGKKSATIQSMEMFDQGWGRINYRTNLTASEKPRKLIVTEVHDWAQVYVDGKLIGVFDRDKSSNVMEIPPTKDKAVLDILVEGTGRINYGKDILDRKGITEKVELKDAKGTTELKNWTVYNFPVDYDFQSNKKYNNTKPIGPAWYKANFTLSKTDDTYLDVSTWGKGMVWVNGHNIGRFWKIGPQQALYMPGVWLKKGQNEIIVLDLEKPVEASITGINHPILDKINSDVSLLSRKPGQELKLAGETPILTGTFDATEDWKEVNFEQTISGRYFCFEAISAQNKTDANATMAEIELIGKDGKAISPKKWKLLYADSEEITTSNNVGSFVFDKQESTMWQTSLVGKKSNYPHQIVIDLGQNEEIKSIRYLPRTDGGKKGIIKDYKLYFKLEPFKF